MRNIQKPLSSQDNNPLPDNSNEGVTILVVEDEYSVRQLVVDMLTMKGFKVLEAHNGVEALALYKNHSSKIKLVLTDVVMPKMSGRKLVEQLNAFSPCQSVLFMSGYAGNEINKQGMLEQPDTHFIQKPFSTNDLITKINGILENRI